MQEMIEPDRTIMIVSIIGLVIIWGSVAYRKFAQKGSQANLDDAGSKPPSGDSAKAPDAGASPQKQQGAKTKNKRKNR